MICSLLCLSESQLGATFSINNHGTIINALTIDQQSQQVCRGYIPHLSTQSTTYLQPLEQKKGCGAYIWCILHICNALVQHQSGQYTFIHIVNSITLCVVSVGQRENTLCIRTNHINTWQHNTWYIYNMIHYCTNIFIQCTMQVALVAFENYLRLVQRYSKYNHRVY